jgi:PRTRC genetic system protein E
MFTELMRLIKSRPLLITVAAEGDGLVRVNVIPKPIDKDKAPNNKIGHAHKEVAPIPEEATRGLTTPLCITGIPEEVDAGLAKALTDFTTAHATLQQSFDTAATSIAEAVQAIDDRERIKKEKDKKEKTGKSATATKPEESKKKEEPGLPSLFTTLPSAPTAVSANDAAHIEVDASSRSR